MKTRIIQLTTLTILLLTTQKLFAQGGASNNSPSLGNTNMLGWKSSGTSADQEVPIENWLVDQNISFKTNDAGTVTIPTTKMTIIGCNTCPLGVASGNVGIGTTSPLQKLEVDNDINLTSSLLNHGYRIGDIIVLHKSGTDNIFVGESAGAAITTGFENVCVGKEAGMRLTTGVRNTLIGFQAGNYLNTATAFENTFVGYQAGFSLCSLTVGGSHNCFFGDVAGYYTDAGHDNTMLGAHSGNFNETGNYNVFVGGSAGLGSKVSQNTFIGFGSGASTVLGGNNAFVGYSSGYQNSSGHDNTMIGTYAGLQSLLNYNTFLGCSTSVVTGLEFNSTAIGWQATVPFHDQMILGNNDVKVGIGLSGDNNLNPGEGPGPQNKLEINAGAYGANGFDPPSALDPGISGLRFRDLTNICSTEPNLGPGVLSVNDHGDVIYVPGLGGSGAFNGTSIDGASNQVQLGQDAIGGSGAELQNDRNVPMNNFDLYFTDPAHIDSWHNNVAIGTLYPSTFVTNPARLTVEKTTIPEEIHDAIAGEFTGWCGASDALGRSIGVWGKGLQVGGNTNALVYGGLFEGKGVTSQGTYGVWARGDNGAFTWGGRFIGGGNVGGTFAVGAQGEASKCRFNIGVRGNTWAPFVLGQTNYAVFGDLGPIPAVPPCGAFPCPAVTAPNIAGYFNGDLLSTTAVYTLSDANLKDNVQDISDPLSIINQLQPKSYTFKQEDNQSMVLESGQHYGLLAQELETVLPGLVHSYIHPARFDSLGVETYSEIQFKAINYTELIPYLIAAVKEQQQTIEAMQGEIANLSGGGNRGFHGNDDQQSNNNSIDVELKNAKSIILNVAVPNPFAEHTTITYFIPDDVSAAQIIFYDNTGNILKTVDIKEKGAGQINVFAADLSSGIYSYSLIADGKLFETKKMVKQ